MTAASMTAAHTLHWQKPPLRGIRWFACALLRFVQAVPIIVLAVLLCGCAATKTVPRPGQSQFLGQPLGQTQAHNTGQARQAQSQTLLPRADPGYVQWLERQSMLGQAAEFTAQVSGTERIWSNSAAARRVPLLLAAAPNWLIVDPHALNTNQPYFRAAAVSGLAAFMPKAGLMGLFSAPTGERGDIWHTRTPQPADGNNVTSLRFDPALGTDADFEVLAARMDAATSTQAGIQLGGELPPAATGLGPDFILQARRASRFDGLYAMVAVPQKDWGLLPTVPEEWECLPLKPAVAATLADQGLLPRQLTRDNLPWATPGGWAATGEVRGADGQVRRWVYRYSQDPLRPVLLWQDPSGQARRIFSAAVIRHTGLQQQTLAGLRLEALMGLDVPSDVESSTLARTSHQTANFWAALTPGLDALNEAGREIHRYGGWAMQDDVLPASLTEAVLATSVDFTRDAAVPAVAAYALLSGDAKPLANLLRASLAAGIDQSRMARGLHEQYSVDLRPLSELPQGDVLLQKIERATGHLLRDGRIWSTTASLAALALGLDLGPDTQRTPAQASAPTAAHTSDHTSLTRSPDQTASRNLGPAPGRLTTEQNTALREACLLVLGPRLALPGLAFIGPADLSGALNLPRPQAGQPASRGSVPLWSEGPINAMSSALPASQALQLSHTPQFFQAPLAFGALEPQWADAQSFLHDAARLLLARQNAGLAQGKLSAVITGPSGCLATLTALPQGGTWLWAANFSANSQRFTLTLPANAGATQAKDVQSGRHLPVQGRTLELALPARQARHIILQAP